MRWVVRIAVGILLLLGLAVGGLAFYGGTLARHAIESSGKQALGVDTRVEQVLLRPLRGSFGLSGLAVQNPPGAFQAPHFLGLEEGRIEVELRSLTGDVIQVPLLQLDGISLHLERSGRSTNFGPILESLRSDGEPAPEDPAAEGAGTRVRVGSLVLRNVSATVDPGLGESARVEIRLPEIRLRDVGTGEGGIPTRQLAGVVVKALLEATAEHGGGLPAQIGGLLRGGLDRVKRVPAEVVGEVTRRGSEAARQAAEGAARDLSGRADEAARELGDRVGELFGGSGGKKEGGGE